MDQIEYQRFIDWIHAVREGTITPSDEAASLLEEYRYWLNDPSGSEQAYLNMIDYRKKLMSVIERGEDNG